MDPLRPQVRAAAARVELQPRKPIASLLAGDIRSPLRGSGMQFKEFRHYEAGDDIRHMAWTVTARTRRPTVKLFEEERELNVLLLVDVSGSSWLGSGTAPTKRQMYSDITAMLGLAALRESHPFGVALFSDKVETYLPPRRNRDAVRAAVHHIASQPLTGKRSDLAVALSFASRALKASSLVMVLSDFALPPFQGALSAIARRNEVVLLHGYDSMETGEGPQGVHPAWDPETGNWYLLDMGSRRARSRLGQAHQSLSDSLQGFARSCRAEYLALSTEADYLEALVHYFYRRCGRR